MLKAPKELQSGQSAMLEQLKAIQTTLVEHEKTFREMKERLDKIESDHASLETMRPLLTGLQSDADNNAHHIKVLTARINDSENRSRRNNLVFYGHQDTQNESWEESEKIVIEHCNRLLQTTVQPRDIERAHRIGTFRAGKCRPIIVKFVHFKDKDHILSLSSKLKDTDFSISQDLSPSTRLARKRLIEFGKTQNSSYKLRHETLTVDNKTYVFDHASNTVVEKSS
ncbi:hypothetical protein HPB48_006125 [Haemaphysalis longicornis]|uniref:Uncharacterized protein n=1 Tax=Haemaphysalis longicornis TaxID=44386 RepID=A0A9J6FVN3_HAELO|nr:hypothetical protein HPB48_006125 [Haemaphysalis longicornis]